MSISFANISFKNDKSGAFHTVPISDIFCTKDLQEALSPRHEEDFDPKHLYYCKKCMCPDGLDCEDDHEHKFTYSKAFIFYLAKSQNDMLEKIKKCGRRARPKVLETDSSPDRKKKCNNREDKKKKIKSLKNNMLSARGLATLNQVGSSKKNENIIEDKSDDDTDDSDSENDGKVQEKLKQYQFENQYLQQTVEEQKQQIQSLFQRTSELQQSIQQKEATAPLHQVVQASGEQQQQQQTANGNHNIQQNGLPGIRNAGVQHAQNVQQQQDGIFDDDRENRENNNGEVNNGENQNEPVGVNQAENRNNYKKWMENLIKESLKYYKANNPGHQDRIKRYTMTDIGEKFLGENITVDEIQWGFIQAEKNFTSFVRRAAAVVWTPYDLKNRAIDINKIQKQIRFDERSPVKPAERSKLRLLISLADDYLLRTKKCSPDEKMFFLRQVTGIVSKLIRDLKSEDQRTKDKNQKASQEKELQRFREAAARRRLDYDSE